MKNLKDPFHREATTIAGYRTHRPQVSNLPEFVPPVLLSHLHVEEIHTLEDLIGGREVWNTLVAQCPTARFYLSHEWMTTWWQSHQDSNKQLLILFVYEADRLIGIAPLMQVKIRRLGFTFEKIEFLSMMKYADSPSNCACALDFITNRPADVTQAVLRHLSEHYSGWQYIRLHPIPETSASLIALREQSACYGMQFSSRKVYRDFAIVIEDGWEKYYEQRSSSFRKKLRNLERRLQKEGTVEYHEYRSLNEAGDLFGEILEIERNSWKWEKGIAITSVAFRNFYQLLAEKCSKTSDLIIWMVRLNGKPIAYELNVQFGDTVESLKCGYRTEYSRCSPSTLLTWRLYERATKYGIKRIELLWGNAEYKRSWSTHETDHHEVFLFRRGFRPAIMRCFVITLNFYSRSQSIAMLWWRLMRKLGFHPENSELTRTDQLPPN